MQNEYVLGIVLALAAQLVAAVSQVLLKIAAGRKYPVWWKSYLNFLVITAYGMFFATTIINVFALKHIPLSFSAALGAAGQIFVPILSAVFLREKIARKKWPGILTIVLGIIVFSM